MIKYDYPEFFKLRHKANYQKISLEFDEMLKVASGEKSVHCGRGNLILDLTYIEEKLLKYPNVSFAGSSTERAVSHYNRATSLKDIKKRLSIGRQKDPMADDRNHNCFKKFAENTYTADFLKSLGSLSKATFALLEPNSWWPSHFDFSINHAAKVNIPIRTNADAVSMVWNNRENKLVKKNLGLGEVWWVNTAHRHTAFNWGKCDRLFLLATYTAPSEILKEVFIESL